MPRIFCENRMDLFYQDLNDILAGMFVRIVSLILAIFPSLVTQWLNYWMSDRPGTGDAYKSKNAPKDWPSKWNPKSSQAEHFRP